MAYMKGRNKDEREQCLTNWADRNKKWITPALRSNNRDREGGHKRNAQEQDGGRDQRGGRRPFRTAALQCMEDISDAYCHKVGMNIGEVADKMDWQFFANCTRDDEFGLVDDSSEEEDDWDCDGGEEE